MKIAGLLLAIAFSAGAGANGTDDIEWRYHAQHGAVTLKLNPMGTAQRQAFYLGRGFTAQQIAPYARACGFSVGLLNDANRQLHTDLRNWYAIDGTGQRTSLRLPEAWDAEWSRMQIPSLQRIAFRWAQFQAENTFEPGDWIMGMATLEKPVHGPFSLVARFRLGGKTQEIRIDELRCNITE